MTLTTPTVILDGRGYALVPIASKLDAERLHTAGVCIRIESNGNSVKPSHHVDRHESFEFWYDHLAKSCPLDRFGERTKPQLFAVFRP